MSVKIGTSNSFLILSNTGSEASNPAPLCPLRLVRLANRTSLKGQRGAGLEASLPVFDKIKKELDVPILTDIHNAEQCSLVADHVDVLQIPAFLCRQTDLLIAAAAAINKSVCLHKKAGICNTSTWSATSEHCSAL